MLLIATALKPYIDSMRKEYFSSSEEDQGSSMGPNLLVIIFVLLLLFISAYGAARLSYYYNMSFGNSGSAVFWSVLAFFFSDLYYPYYSFFLNPLSLKRRNNIVL